MSGYGIFWSIVEDLYNNSNQLMLDYEGIAYDLRSDIETIKDTIKNTLLYKIIINLQESRIMEIY